jgi:hypothetical protein
MSPISSGINSAATIPCAFVGREMQLAPPAGVSARPASGPAIPFAADLPVLSIGTCTGQAAPTHQGRLVSWPVRHAIAGLRDLVAAAFIELVRHKAPGRHGRTAGHPAARPQPRHSSVLQPAAYAFHNYKYIPGPTRSAPTVQQLDGANAAISVRRSRASLQGRWRSRR